MRLPCAAVQLMASAILGMWSISTVQVSGHPIPHSLPGQVGKYVAQHVNLNSDHYTRLFQGEPVTKVLPSDASKDLAVFGAIWVNAPIAAYIAAVKNIEQLEKGPNFPVTKKISTPPRLEDFARLSLTPEDVEDLKTCKVGNCELKLGEDALQRIQREVDWSKPQPEATAQVEALFKSMALDYVIRYQEAGNEALAAYRDTNRPTFVAQEFKTMIDGMPLLTEHLPQLKEYLLEYPKASMPGAESFLYWQSAKFGLKPTIRINHVIIVERPDVTAVASKMLYANHYFRTAIELRLLVPDRERGEGFWFTTISQTRSDGLGGYLGPIVRAKVRDEAQKGMEAALKAGKSLLEKS